MTDDIVERLTFGFTEKEAADEITRLRKENTNMETALRNLLIWKAKHEWQPIETAPKDGTRIITALGNVILFNEWNDPAVTKLGTLSWWHSRPSEQPNYWMPIPKVGIRDDEKT